jgi:hypothetical protein
LLQNKQNDGNNTGSCWRGAPSADVTSRIKIRIAWESEAPHTVLMGDISPFCLALLLIFVVDFYYMTRNILRQKNSVA